MSYIPSAATTSSLSSTADAADDDSPSSDLRCCPMRSTASGETSEHDGASF